MNILLVGTADAVACAAANRLYKEGDALTWITAEKEARLWNSRFRGNIYRAGYHADQIIRIMRLHSVEAVIFSFAGKDIEGSQEENEPILALSHMLQAVQNYRLKQFVYISSIELEYHQTLTPQLAWYQYGEALCLHYQEKLGLPLLILRMGMVYGNCSARKMGFVGELITAGVRGRTVFCRKAAEDYVDLIHAEDAAMAINCLLKLEKTGIYPVISGHPIRMRQLQELIEELLGYTLRIHYQGTAQCLSEKEYWERSCPLKADTGWIPFYLPMEKGRDVLELALQRERNEQDALHKEKHKKISLREILRRYSGIMGIAETLILFLLMQLVLPFTRSSEDLRFVDVRLLFTAFLAVSFGMKIGMLATVLACISYGGALRAEGIDIFFLMYSVDTWIPFIVYGIAGALFGYISDRKNDTMKEIQEKYGNIYERYTFLKEVHKETLEVKSNLQQQITASKESFGKVYEVAQQLNSLSPEQISFRAVEVVADMMGGCQVAIWRISLKKREFARREACTVQIASQLPNSLRMDARPLIVQGFEHENLFVNRQLEEGYPDFAAPIYRNGAAIAFVAVYQLPAERFTLYYQNLFRMVTGLIENSLVRALAYEEKRREEIYLPGTELLKAEEFAQRLALLKEEKEKISVTFLLLHIITREKEEPAVISEKLQMLIRGNDFAGIDDQGYLCVALINAGKADYESIKKRFQGRGLEVELWN